METSQLVDNAVPLSPVKQARAISIAILAMGGEGGGVLADWIVDLAEHCGYLAQTTSVPGVAQRTGATIYYVELFPEAASRAAGKQPVLALMPVPGEVDIVIASELMEAGRAITRGLVSADRTTLIASTNRVYSMTEKIAMADGRVNSDALIQSGREKARRFISQDFARMAEENGSVISATLFGALAASGTLPFDRKSFEDAIERSGVSVASSKKAFSAAFDSTQQPVVGSAERSSVSFRKAGPLWPFVGRIQSTFPSQVESILLPAIQKLAEHQDLQYVQEYLDRLEPIRDLDRQYGKRGDFGLLRETARYLALWMSYEDAIRVADLKIRRSRFERVRKDAHVKDDQLVVINEFLHPRVEEFADILPAGIGGWLLNTKWAHNFVNRLTKSGKVLHTSSISGFLQLYLVAGLRRWRRGSLRFRRESRRIASWLGQIRELAPADYALACEVAESPRLIKGYGDTYLLGSRNFETLMTVISRLRRSPEPAARLRALREAALADDTGAKLADKLREFNLLPGGSS